MRTRSARAARGLAWCLLAVTAAACVAAQPSSSALSSTGAASPAATVSTPPAGSPSADEGLVAWVDRPAPPYVAPSPSLPAADARPCEAADLRATAGPEGAGLGNTNLPVTLVDRSTSACVLKGYPTLVGIDAKGIAHPIAAEHGSYFGDPGPAANIAPGASAAVNISGADACPAILGGGHRIYAAFRIGLPAGGSVEVAAAGFDAICGVSVSQFGVPAAATPPGEVPSSPLTAAISAPASVPAGTTLTYVVTLANPTATDYPLAPCPSYEEYVGSGSATWVATVRDYYLDCDTTSVIPAGAAVRFEMELAIPADQPPGQAKFGWDVPGGGGPGAVQPLQVLPPGASEPIASSPTAESTADASATPDTADATAARSLAERFLSAFVAEQWSTAYGLLAPESQQAWGGSVTAFAANWPHPARDTGGHYTIADQLNDPAQVATLADGALTGADLARSYLFDVTFPDPTGAIPGPSMTLVAAPDATGAWHLWRLR